MTLPEEQQAMEHKDIIETMAHAQGRRVLYRVLKLSGCLDRPGAFDPNIMAFMEGQRSIGFEFLKDIIDQAPKKFMVMLMEAKEREQERQRKAKHGENYERNQ